MSTRKLLQQGWQKKLEIIQSPNGNSVWKKGSSYSVSWTGSFSLDDFVQIVLSESSNSLHATLVPNTNNNGNVQVSIPTSLPTSNNYRIQIILLNSDGNFIVSDVFNIVPVSSKSADAIPLGVVGAVLYALVTICGIYIIYRIYKVRKFILQRLRTSKQNFQNFAAGTFGPKSPPQRDPKSSQSLKLKIPLQPENQKKNVVSEGFSKEAKKSEDRKSTSRSSGAKDLKLEDVSATANSLAHNKPETIAI